MDLQAPLHKIITRLIKLLTPAARALIKVREEGGSSNLADADADAGFDEGRSLRPLQAVLAVT